MTHTVEAGIEGSPPVVLVRTIEETRQEAEAAKYAKMWARPEYRSIAPGEGVALTFLQQAKPAAGAAVIDFGAGTGRGALMLALMGNLKVEMLDFAANCLDPEVAQALQTQAQSLRFTLHDLTKPVPISAPYGFCTDVMEHIHPQDVDRVLQNVLTAAQHVFFQISCVDDCCGKLIGEPLHLSIHPYAWWLKKLQELDCVVHWSEDQGHQALFYVTAWQGGETLAKAGVLNVSEQQIVDNVRANIAGDWIQISPHEANDFEVMILGGGASLTAQVDEIKRLRAAGAKLVTTNGAYNWAIEHGLKPSATVVIDAREFNGRFTKPVIDDCKYLICSQAHPSVLEGLPKDRTYLWHTPMESIREILNEKYPLWFQIPGGSTVMLRTIPLLRLLGFKKFHLFGFDSCLTEVEDTRDDKEDIAILHHAYPQPENEKDPEISCVVGDRAFRCHPWMVSQAQEFMDLVKFLGNEIDLEIYGDGLIAHILKVGASKADFLT